MKRPVNTRAHLRLLGVWGTLVAVLAGLLVACGSSDGSTPDDDGSGGTESASAEPEPYLDVPSDVTLTEPGSELALGESAVVAWEPRQQQVGALKVNVVRLERTTWEPFSGWKLDKQTKKMKPYFAHARITNVGDSDVGDRAVPLYGLDSESVLIESSKFRERFRPCPGNGVFPQKFKPKAKQQVCLVFLVEPGRHLRGVGFRPTQDFEQISWVGKADQPGGGKRSGKKKQNDKGD